VEWNRLPHFQDVTIRLIAQNGILRGPKLYLQGEAAMGKVSLPAPFAMRQYHLFCSPFNAGAETFAEELKNASIYATKGKQPSVPLSYTTDVNQLASCDHMLVLLDARTWTSGEDTAKFVEHIHEAMKTGVHLNCIHEFPAVVGPPRFECEFALMFGDDWTPAHLTGGKTNLYKEIAFALKGVEWRQPGLVAVASKLIASAGEHTPIDFTVPGSYTPKRGENKWDRKAKLKVQIDATLLQFDSNRDFIVNPEELLQLLIKVDSHTTIKQAIAIHNEMLKDGYDSNEDGKTSVEECALYWVEKGSSAEGLISRPGSPAPLPAPAGEAPLGGSLKA